jgi:Xaa-Pro aminopeptidase
LIELGGIIAACTGFTGSMAALIAAKSKYYIFVDGRYWEQAESECFSDVLILDIFEVPIENFLLDCSPQPEAIGVDPKSVTHAYFERLSDFSSRINSRVRSVDVHSLVASMDGGRAVTAVAEPCFVRTARPAKLQDRVRSAQRLLSEIGTDAYYSNDSRLIGWLTGLGRVGYDMLVPGSCLIRRRGRIVLFFPDKIRIGIEELQEFANEMFEFAPITRLSRMLPKCASCAVPSMRVSEWEWRTLKRRVRPSSLSSDPFELLRSVRDEEELSHLEEANIKDAIAVTELFAEIAERLQNERLSEYDIATRLDELRAKQAGFIHLSFPSIVAAGPNAAIPHYHVDAAESRKVKKNDVILIDSGSHYEDGTTDITRTVCVGRPSSKFRRSYSLVLKAHVGLARAKFRSGSRGFQLDAFARGVLWKEGLDFEHGTGHGVGFLSHVHDLPFRITKFHGNEMFFASMVVTIEPGLYFAGEFGIRIENMYAIKTDDSDWLGFAVLTRTPIPTAWVDWDIFDVDERAWVWGFNEMSYKMIDARLSDRAKSWVRGVCPELA